MDVKYNYHHPWRKNRGKKTQATQQRIQIQGGTRSHQGVKTISQLGSAYNLHPTQIGNWKKQLLREGSAVFIRPNSQAKRDRESKCQ